MATFKKSVLNLIPPQHHSSPYIRLCLNRSIATYFPDKPSPLGKSAMSNRYAIAKSEIKSASSMNEENSPRMADRELQYSNPNPNPLFKLTLKLAAQEVVFSTFNDTLQEFITKVIFYITSNPHLYDQCKVCYIEGDELVNGNGKIMDVVDPLFLALLLKKQSEITLTNGRF